MIKLSPKEIKAVVDWMNKWEQLKNTAIPIRFREDFTEMNDELISIKYLRELHPELTESDADEYLIFCNDNTIRYKECYGHGQIMMPKWLATKKDK